MTKAVIIFFVSTLFFSCSIQQINVGKPEKIEIEELSMKAVKLKIMVPIENPNNFSFKLKNANLDLIVNKKNVGGVKKVEKLKIPANSNQSYPVSFELSTSDAFTTILFLMNELKSRSPELEVTGHITVSAFGIPKRIKVEHEQKF